ncbi:MAG: nucleotidyltransferase family protein [Anaerolineales bacterium]|nr:nucleotidyltransferase family protein [Anaerolineales bacterium]MCX7754223.1 nucleotidyltransferase family protein [Anaerolineales bacterium]MDW8276927.1 nucleotidyltransferase family protein [Anaerolineales bacterium]
MNGSPSLALAAIVLAAGLSRRMGRPKMLLPWRETTVLGRVAKTLAESGVQEIVIVTGGERPAVEAEAAQLAQFLPVRTVFNPHYESGEMMSSLRVGLAALGAEIQAALIAPGDQPQLSLESARKMVSTWQTTGARLLVPSFKRRRGHPWLVRREMWPELAQAETARAFLNTHADEILYVECDETVLKDLDTPEDYARDLQNAV